MYGEVRIGEIREIYSFWERRFGGQRKALRILSTKTMCCDWSEKTSMSTTIQGK